MWANAQNPTLFAIRGKSAGRQVTSAETRRCPGDSLIRAARSIREGNASLARALLKSFAAGDMENAQAYNLLGLSYEREGNREKAARFYRVAYYMDQAFEAPQANLERVCAFWYKGFFDVSWGIDTQGDETT